MKKLKLILSMLTVSAMTFGSGFCSHGLDYCDSLTYIISEKEAVITGYNGDPKVINFPSQINGVPVTAIRENAFYKCDSLEEIIVPQSVSEIGHHAFFECKSLKTATINGRISEVSEGLFYGCNNLESININAAPSLVDDYAFFGCHSLNEFDLPMSVIDIGTYSFADCSNLSDISLNNKLKNIEPYSFYNCDSLAKINLPESLLAVGKCAIGFSDKGLSESTTITGTLDSAAEYYAQSNNVKFKNRVYYKQSNTINLGAVARLLEWLSFATVYVLLMVALFTNSKARKKRAC